MNKILSAIIVGLLLGCYAFGQTPSKADFSGTWILDTAKTKNLPKELESYTISVKQLSDKIDIKTEVKGDIQMRRGGGQGGNRGEGGGQRGGFGGGGGRGEGGEGGGGFGGGAPSFNGRIALQGYFPEIVYMLDEQESIIDIKQGETVTGKAKMKTKWKKDGKVLEMTITREFDRNGQKMSIPTKENWELADEGKTLKIKREVSMPMGLDSINLVFNKQ